MKIHKISMLVSIFCISCFWVLIFFIKDYNIAYYAFLASFLFALLGLIFKK